LASCQPMGSSRPTYSKGLNAGTPPSTPLSTPS
jgi:hypothetical protein